MPKAFRVKVASALSSTTKPHAHALICADVTEVHADIITEGSILSYGQYIDSDGDGALDTISCDDKTVDDDGFPVISPPTFEKTILKNQLTFYGTIVSCNTAGGSVKTPPVKCDGTRALTAEDIQKAKRQDLNYLRYACVIENKFWTEGRPDRYWWCDDMKPSPSLGAIRPPNDQPNEIPENYPGKYGIVNFFPGKRINLPLFD